MKQNVLITGATRGIGRELAKQLAELGFRVFATGRDEALLESLKAETGCLGAAADLAKTSQVNYSTYCTMKHGLMGFTKCLIKEAREVNVKVSAIYPGGTDTDFRTEERSDYLLPASAARMIVHCITAPQDVVVHDLTYRPMVESNF